MFSGVQNSCTSQNGNDSLQRGEEPTKGYSCRVWDGRVHSPGKSGNVFDIKLESAIAVSVVDKKVGKNNKI